MPLRLARKLKTLILICLYGCFAGFLYQFINENQIDQRSLIVGIPLGLVFGILELFLIPAAANRLNRWPFTLLISFKTVLYSTVIFVVSVLIMFLDGLAEGRKLIELYEVAVSMDQLRSEE